MNRTIKKVTKKTIVFPIYLMHIFIVEMWVGAGMSDVWDKMWEWTNKQ